MKYKLKKREIDLLCSSLANQAVKAIEIQFKLKLFTAIVTIFSLFLTLNNSHIIFYGINSIVITSIYLIDLSSSRVEFGLIYPDGEYLKLIDLDRDIRKTQDIFYGILTLLNCASFYFSTNMFVT